MKTITTILIALFIGTQGQVYTQAECESLFYSPQVNEKHIQDACSEAWAGMYNREYYPNY